MAIPSWLQISPDSFLGATEAGTQSGIAIGEFQQQEKARAMQQAAAAAQEHAKLEQTQKLADMDAQLTQKKIQSDFLKSMAQTNAMAEYRKLNIGLQQDRVKQQAQDATQKFLMTQTAKQNTHAENIAKIGQTGAYQAGELADKSAGRQHAESAMQLNYLSNQVNNAQNNLKVAQKAFDDATDKSPQGVAALALMRAKQHVSEKQDDYTKFGNALRNPVAPNPAQRPTQPPAQASGGLPDLTGVPAPSVAAPAMPQPPQGQPAAKTPPAVKGAVVKQNGKTYQYDGEHWLTVDGNDI